MANQDEGEGEDGCTSRVGYFQSGSGLKKVYGGKRCIFTVEQGQGWAECVHIWRGVAWLFHAMTSPQRLEKVLHRDGGVGIVSNREDLPQ